MNRNKMIEVALSLNLEPKEEVLLQLESEFDQIMASLESVKQINVDNVLPMTRIGTAANYFMREDVVKDDENIQKQDLLNNSKDATEDFVKIKRVIHG